MQIDGNEALHHLKIYFTLKTTKLTTKTLQETVITKLSTNLFCLVRSLSKFVILMGLSLPSIAQDKYSISSWPINSLLSQSTIINSKRSKDGMLWIVTLDGVSRFDGNSLLDFRPNRSGIGFLGSSKVVAVLEDKQGNIYVATKDLGLLAHRKATDSFTLLSCCELEKSSESEITAAYSDSLDRIWLGHENGSISIITPRLGSTKSLENVSKSPITTFDENKSGAILAGSSTGELYHFDKRGTTPSLINMSDECKSQLYNLKHIAVIDDFNMWVGTRDNGLHLVNSNEAGCKKIHLQGNNRGKSGNVNIHTILHDDLKEMTLVATDQGLYILNGIDRIRHFHIENSRLANNEVTSISSGRNGLYWIGTFSGLNYLIPTEIDSYGPATNSQLHSIVAVDSSTNGDLWIASYDGLMKFDPATQEHMEIQEHSPIVTLTNRKIMSLNIDNKGMWVGYRSSGLELYSQKRQKVLSFNTQSTPKLPSNFISAVLTASNDEVLIGMHGGGLSIISKELTISQNFLENKKIVMLYETNDGLVWIGTESGLFSLDTKSKRLTEIQIDSLAGENQAPPIVWTMAESANGDLWLGTMHHGLFLWPIEARESKRVSLEKPFLLATTATNSIYAIQIDDSGNIWCSTNRGLVRIDPNDGSVYVIARHHGLSETEFDFGVSHKDAHGFLYFGGSKGYSRINPLKLNISTTPPSVKLTKIQLAGLPPLPPGQPHKSTPIQLTHKNYFVTFTFSVLDFLDPEKNQFRYKLENFDPEWIENGTRNTATYTNLPPGEYVLRVQGANSSGVWNREGISLNVIVLPAPWRTWWAYCFYGVLFFGLARMGKRTYDSYSIERRAIQLAKEKYEAENKADDDMQEQLELQDDIVKSTYSHNVATLSLIKDFISWQADYLPEQVFRDSSEGNIGRIEALSLLESCLHFHNDGLSADLQKYVNLITSRLLENAPIRQESITTINEVSSRRVPAQIASPLAILIFELLENCIQHAFESESLANYIQVMLEEVKPELAEHRGYRLTVQDNGIGLPEGLRTHIAETPGLAIIQSITKRLGSTLQISTNNGTKVILELPPSN